MLVPTLCLRTSIYCRMHSASCTRLCDLESHANIDTAQCEVVRRAIPYFLSPRNYLGGQEIEDSTARLNVRWPIQGNLKSRVTSHNYVLEQQIFKVVLLPNFLPFAQHQTLLHSLLIHATHAIQLETIVAQ